jgi:hypothetical protein
MGSSSSRWVELEMARLARCQEDAGLTAALLARRSCRWTILSPMAASRTSECMSASERAQCASTRVPVAAERTVAAVAPPVPSGVIGCVDARCALAVPSSSHLLLAAPFLSPQRTLVTRHRHPHSRHAIPSARLIRFTASLACSAAGVFPFLPPATALAYLGA